MPKMIGINIGFVTNSSSMVHHFPKSLLNDPEIKTFLAAFEVENGFVGDDMWCRSGCASFAVTKEQKEAIQSDLNREGYEDFRPPSIPMDDDTVVVVYGDEHPGLAMTISRMLQDAAKRAGVETFGGSEYN